MINIIKHFIDDKTSSSLNSNNSKKIAGGLERARLFHVNYSDDQPSDGRCTHFQPSDCHRNLAVPVQATERETVRFTAAMPMLYPVPRQQRTFSVPVHETKLPSPMSSNYLDFSC